MQTVGLRAEFELGTSYILGCATMMSEIATETTRQVKENINTRWK